MPTWRLPTCPASPAFVPLLGELTSRLLGRHRGTEAVLCGEPLAVYLPPAAGPAAGLHSRRHRARWKRPASWWRKAAACSGAVEALKRPGIYQVKRQGTPVFAVAVAVPPEES